ncbi:argininosuccinate synthase [Aciditerrimonas ferrireducens]|uniref:argininosuccinate synthase n=1 Tax=Aciditerrimonas ferrireducens TaxID=667306 RepID=A0ABV6C535_9ACTN
MDVRDLQGRTVAFLASGGLDSCTITHWLASHGVRVVCYTADLGQGDEPDLGAVAERMRACGAAEAHVLPLVDEVAEAGLGAVQAQARYEGGYWNTTPLARYVTVRGALRAMAKAGITVLSHGATGRGNDQVRFQLATNMLAPSVEVYAPWRDGEFLARFGGREEMIEYCLAHELPIKPPGQAKYSTDANLLGLTHEAGELERLTTPASFVTPEMGVRPTEAPEEPEAVRVVFDAGRPVEVGGRPTGSAQAALRVANEIGGRHGVGIGLHLVENRFVGVKSRGVYEAPGMELLGQAYAFLLQLLLDRRARRLFDTVSAYLAEQIYQGYGEDLGSSLARGVVAEVAALASGTIEVACYKGGVSFLGASDVPRSLYAEEAASMSRSEAFDHHDSEGFLRVLGVGAKVASRAGQVPGVAELAADE